MEGRPPNEEGTGRHKFSHINNVRLIFIPKNGAPEPNPTTKNDICQFMAKYLRIPCH
jgi:hypothetical protein